MTDKLKTILLFISVALVLMIFFYVGLVIYFSPTEKNTSSENSLIIYFKKKDVLQPEEIQLNDFKSIYSEVNFLKSRDSILVQEEKEKIVSQFTDSLLNQNLSIINKNPLEAYFQLSIFITRLKAFEAIDEENIYRYIRLYWNIKINDFLNGFISNYPRFRFNNKVLFITYFLNEENYYPDFKNTNTEKFFINIMEGNFSYLIKRIFINSTIEQKIPFLLFLVFNIFVYYRAFFKKTKS